MAESDRGKVFSLKTNPQTHHLYATVSEESVIGITTAPIILCATFSPPFQEHPSMRGCPSYAVNTCGAEAIWLGCTKGKFWRVRSRPRQRDACFQTGQQLRRHPRLYRGDRKALWR